MMFWTVTATILVLSIVLAGCVSVSGGTWYIREASLPEGWPTLSSVGQVQVKQYPAYRAAVVESSKPDGEGSNRMFGVLFRHIKSREIAMTAPVEMAYETSGAEDVPSRVRSMAFLYRNPTQGKTESDGQVQVQDVAAQTYATVGVRGAYTAARFDDAVTMLDAWLTEHAATWQRDGELRFLGYNSPFVPAFARYGEVQMPIRRTED